MDIQAVAFTGHRPKKFPWKYDESDPECVALKEAIARKVSEFASGGIVHYLSGMAEGVDLWAAQAVLELREQNRAVKLHCILPCTNQADKWPDSSQERYRAILNRADSIWYVSREYHKNCMLERNRFMVKHSTILFAVYNGEPRGGTAATIRYARKLCREIFVLAPATLNITHETPDSVHEAHFSSDAIPKADCQTERC